MSHGASGEIPPRESAETVVQDTPARSIGYPVLPGQLLCARFRIVRKLGQGAMGVVFEAFDEKLDRRIALKCGKARYNARLSPEVRLASDVSHRNICKTFEIHTAELPDGPLEFFTMEFLEGETLHTLLRARRLPTDEARNIALQLCAGLAEAHRHQIVHGDLKSANVIVAKDPDGGKRAVITDFGLARHAHRGGLKGWTPGYAAPEIRSGAPTSVKSDVYALGVILHELAYGVRPDENPALLAGTSSRSGTADENPARSGSEPASASIRPSGLGRADRARWNAVVKRCLAPDPERRYASANEVGKALGPSVFRRRAIAAAAAVAFAAAAAGITYQRATEPTQRVRLSIAPLTAVSGPPGLAAQVQDAVAHEIAQLHSSAQTAFSIGARRDATHTLTGSLEQSQGRIVLQAALKDLKSDAVVVKWRGEYSPGQAGRYAPTALSGVISSAFHLPPSKQFATVSPAAEPLYREGLKLLRQDRKMDEAIDILQKAVALDPDSALTYAALAEAERRKFFLTSDSQWLEQARQSTREAELRNPDCPEVHSIAGLLYVDSEQREMAIARLQRATEFSYATSDPYRRLGAVYQRNGLLEEALRFYHQALAVEPDFYRIRQDMASLYFGKSQYQDAIREYQAAIRLAPSEPQLYALLAASFKNLGRFADAESALRTAIRLDRTAPVLAELGHVLMYERKEKEAIASLKQATEQDPKQYFSWMYLGICYRRTGRQIEAQAAFRHGLKLAQDDVMRSPRSGYDRAFLAYLCAQTGDIARAEAEAAQSLQLSPGQASAIWLAALTYEALGQRDRALAILASAPRTLLTDLQRWPEASGLTTDERFLTMLAAAEKQAS